MKPNGASEFWARVNKNGQVPLCNPSLGPCWLWEGRRGKKYGQFDYCGRTEVAHRMAWLFTMGKWPEYTLDHLCRVTTCVNPSHLEDVPLAKNILRGFGPPAINKRKTQCKRGHALAGENILILGRNRRACRICTLESAARSARERRRTRRAGAICAYCQKPIMNRTTLQQRCCSRKCREALWRTRTQAASTSCLRSLM